MKRLAILVVLLAVLVSVAVAQETTDRPPITIDNAPQVRSIETLDGHLTQVMSTDFSADGTVLATGALDRTIKVWDMVAVEPITVIDQNLERVWHISLNADGTRVASVHRGGSAYVWDAQTGGQLLHLQGHIGNVQAVTFSVDDTRLYTGGADLSLRVWDAQTGEMLHVFDNLGFESLRSPLDIQPISDSQVAIATGELAGGMSKMDHPEGCVVMVVNVDDGTVASQIDGVPCSIWNVAILPEQELIAFGDGRGMVHIVDLATAETIQRLDSNPLGIRRGVAFSSDGNLLAVAGYNGMLQLWDVENGMLISAAESRSSLIQSIAFSPDDSLIVTGNFDGKVELWAVTDDPMPDAQPSESSSAEEDAGQPSEPGERPLAPRELPTMVIGLGENYFTSDIKTNVTQKLTYEGSAGEELTLAFNGYGVRITVVAPSGEILAEFNEAQSVDLVLPENGQYQIELFGETGGLVSLTLSNTR